MGFFDAIKNVVSALSGEKPDAQMFEDDAVERAREREQQSIQMAQSSTPTSMDNLMNAACSIMLCDDTFEILGRGVVATGKVFKGSFKLFDEVLIVSGPQGNPILSKVTGIEQFSKKLNTANEGEKVGMFLSGIKKNQIKKGDMIIKD